MNVRFFYVISLSQHTKGYKFLADVKEDSDLKC